MCSLLQAKEDSDKPGLVAILQKVLQLYAACLLSKRSYATKGMLIFLSQSAQQFILTSDFKVRVIDISCYWFQTVLLIKPRSCLSKCWMVCYRTKFTAVQTNYCLATQLLLVSNEVQWLNHIVSMLEQKLFIFSVYIHNPLFNDTCIIFEHLKPDFYFLHQRTRISGMTF